MKILYTQHVASAPDNHICFQKPILTTTQSSHFTTLPWWNRLARTAKAQQLSVSRIETPHRRQDWSWLQRREESRARPDSCSCALCFMSVLRRNLQTGQTQEAASQRPAAGLKLIPSQGRYLQHTPPLTRYYKLFCRVAPETWCWLPQFCWAN